MVSAVINSVNAPVRSFPKIMVSQEGRVVLFSGPNVGVLLYGCHVNIAGYHSETWFMDSFSDFDGSITLSNGG